MLPVTIRPLVSSDLAAYKLLRDDMLAAHPESFTSEPAPERSPDSYLARLGLGQSEGGEFTLGAWRVGELVGAVSCERDSRPKIRHIGHIIGMMVREQARGAGIGRKLLQACIEQTREADGLLMLTLTVTTGNAAAVHLYERAGFVLCGRLPRAICINGRFHSKDHMVLDL